MELKDKAIFNGKDLCFDVDSFDRFFDGCNCERNNKGNAICGFLDDVAVSIRATDNELHIRGAKEYELKKMASKIATFILMANDSRDAVNSVLDIVILDRIKVANEIVLAFYYADVNE